MREDPNLRAAMAVAMASAVFVVAGLAAQSSDARRSTREGVYASEQAARGKAQYEYFCARCHLAALEGDDGATYIDIVAYILQANGFPAGRQELGLDPGPLAQIAMFDK
jgi:hypothetical protein